MTHAPSWRVAAAIAVSASLGASGDAVRGQERWRIMIDRGGASVAFARFPHRCAADGSSFDTLRGVVESRQPRDGEGVTVYEGVLERVTEQELCGSDPYPAPRTGAGRTPACRARLSGIGEVHVRITVYRSGHDPHGAWVVLTPTDVMASVSGNCRPPEMHAMRAAYGDRTTLEIPTPPGRLLPGRYAADQAPGEPGRWVLTVVSVPGPSS
jgi:hypothetical protein